MRLSQVRNLSVTTARQVKFVKAGISTCWQAASPSYSQTTSATFTAMVGTLARTLAPTHFWSHELSSHRLVHLQVATNGGHSHVFKV
jgi:hypothetical protein